MCTIHVSHLLQLRMRGSRPLERPLQQHTAVHTSKNQQNGNTNSITVPSRRTYLLFSFNMHWKQVFKLLSLHFNYSSPASLSLKLLWPVSHVLVPSLAFSQKKKVNIFGKFRFEEKIKNNKVPNRCSVLFLRIWSDRGLWGYPRRQEGLCLHEQAQPRPSCRDTE